MPSLHGSQRDGGGHPGRADSPIGLSQAEADAGLQHGSRRRPPRVQLVAGEQRERPAVVRLGVGRNPASACSTRLVSIPATWKRSGGAWATASWLPALTPYLPTSVRKNGPVGAGGHEVATLAENGAGEVLDQVGPLGPPDVYLDRVSGVEDRHRRHEQHTDFGVASEPERHDRSRSPAATSAASDHHAAGRLRRYLTGSMPRNAAASGSIRHHPDASNRASSASRKLLAVTAPRPRSRTRPPTRSSRRARRASRATRGGPVGGSPPGTPPSRRRTG